MSAPGGRASSAPVMGRDEEPTVFELSVPDRRAWSFRDTDLPEWDAADLKKRRAQLSLLRWWGSIYGTAVMTGVTGALLLIYNCLAVSLNLTPFPR